MSAAEAGNHGDAPTKVGADLPPSLGSFGEACRTAPARARRSRATFSSHPFISDFLISTLNTHGLPENDLAPLTREEANGRVDSFGFCCPQITQMAQIEGWTLRD